MKRQNFLRVCSISLLAAVAAFGCATGKKNAISLNDMKELSRNHALVVAYNDGKVNTYNDKGIKPLFRHLENANFKDSYVFDKVTGKASSLILAYGGAESLYTGILSKEAIPVLEKYNIKYSADEIVEYIINQAGDDKCPIEKTVSDIDDPQIAFQVLKEKFGNN
jgi:Domain of unknown function (DUF1893).